MVGERENDDDDNLELGDDGLSLILLVVNYYMK